MRKILLLLAVVVAIVCGVAASTLRTRVAESAPEVARQLAEKLDVRIELGEVSTSFLPLGAEIKQLRVSGKSVATQPFLSVDSLRVEAALLPLLWGRLEVRALVANRPRVEILKNDHDAYHSTMVPERLFASLADVPFALDVHDGSVLFEDHNDDPPSRLLATSIDGTVHGAVDGTLEMKLEGAALGESSKGKLSLRVKPGVGPTGGDDVALELDVDDGSAAALRQAFILLRSADLRDPVKLSVRAAGLLGEKSTESQPAQPLLGKLTGTVGVGVAGLVDRLALDVDLGLDDTRYLVRGGTGTWSGLRFVPTGWITRISPRKVSGRLDVEPFELSAMAERFGVAERWRPHGRPNLTLRLTGSSIEPLYRYEGAWSGFTFDAWPTLPIKSGSSSVRGSLAAVNTDVSTSFDARDLQVGTLHIDRALFGLAYWRDKLTVTALDAHVYGGTLNGSVAFWPKTSVDPQGGLLVRDADGKTVVENALPGLPFQIDGRLDTGIQIGVDERGFWMHGRVGIHRGRIDGGNWAHALVGAALAAAGADGALDAVTAAHRELLATEATRFDRLALDFESRDGIVTLPRIVLEMHDASLRGRGEIAADRSVSLTAALWPKEPLATTLTRAAPRLERARDADGKMVLPCEVRGAAGRVVVRPTSDLLAVLEGAAAASPLEPIRVSPSDFGELARLRQQFGR